MGAGRVSGHRGKWVAMICGREVIRKSLRGSHRSTPFYDTKLIRAYVLTCQHNACAPRVRLRVRQDQALRPFSHRRSGMFLALSRFSSPRGTSTIKVAFSAVTFVTTFDPFL
jgi:hypothetical protein